MGLIEVLVWGLDMGMLDLELRCGDRWLSRRFSS